MADLAFIATVVAFFAAAWLLVGACERIVGADDPALASPTGAPGPGPQPDPEHSREVAA